jgi:hypothetical protein
MIEGSCHCGAVRWTFHGVPTSATACNCTTYRRYGALWAYDYEHEGIESSAPHIYIAAAIGRWRFISVLAADASPIGARPLSAQTVVGVSPSICDSRPNLMLSRLSSSIISLP